MEVILEAGAEDLKNDDEYYEVISAIENFETVRKALEEKEYKIENASLQYIAKDLVTVDGKNAEDVVKCIEAIEEYDDVQNVFTNADFADDTE
jgi:transcriptional/translational regulatory protein YebC/TACO1